ncbi:hypothetical protein [Acinetobacter johnsonii]|jgi:hypothetical protein|uniref:Uncharacterized protein n=3 Tax=Acinetobacter johnsonii TaxID=40214 RepID=A0AAJ6IDF0_ACIJO|nr:hypothetical protein [Acinetobacter johnsonii]WMG16908.1 hypothetical protein QBJ73_10755 [Acinetobacter johnsonii]VXA82571.1 conserved hypothetical protein [Acinetobacter sp. 8I-beige]
MMKSSVKENCFTLKCRLLTTFKFGANLIALGKVTVRIVDAGTMLTVAATLYPI